MHAGKIIGFVGFLGIGMALLLLIAGNSEPVNTVNKAKINGVSFEAPPRFIEAEKMHPVKNLYANWIAITPFAFSRAGEPEVTFNHARQWWGERTEGVVETVQYARELDIKVMIKPHVWVRGQGWPGNFVIENEEEWLQWEKNYEAYALYYARVADSLQVEMFCIGTEFRRAATQRPQFWRKLIAKIRTFYEGDITYAANWDNYQNITFWNELNYIGIDAYFPISSVRSPGVGHLIEKWSDIKNQLQNFSDQHRIPILFTEFGYRSMDYAAGGDWNYDIDTLSTNGAAQANAYEALFKTFWPEPWFAGGFLWKWHPSPERRRKHAGKGFTPQNKPAETTIRRWYRRESF